MLQFIQFNPGFGGGGFQGQLGFPSLNFPINIALSGDGTLVCMTPSQLWIQDLYHPDLAHPRATTPLDASRQAIFVTSTQPNQLLIADGRILAVSDNSRSMRIYSLQNGASLIKSPLSVVTQQTALQPTNDHVGLSVAGTYVYAISQSTVVAYDLDSLANTWKSIVVIKPDIAQSILDKNYLLAMAGVGPQVKVYAWSRAIIKTKAGDAVESGNALFSEPSLSDSADITDMQAVDGGLYYFAGGTLKFARGSREP